MISNKIFLFIKMIKHRQFDIPLTTQFYFTLPSDVKGRITQEDFLYFSWDQEINPSNYDVVLETLQTDFKIIGPLSSIVKLPHVQISNDALFIILPKYSHLPKFIGSPMRGKKYHLTTKSQLYNNFYLL